MTEPTGAMTDADIEASFLGELKPYAVKVVVDDYDPVWPQWYEEDRARITRALGESVVLLEHVGSTSVPGLPAKPIIDILLVVADSSDEAAYLPALEAEGYQLRVREPDWHEHRALAKRVDDGDHHGVNLHVHTVGSVEIARMIDFRDWLRANDSDRDLYAATKRELAKREWKYVQNYADAKTEVIDEIRARMAVV
jgi:GrpB-like predicted nucleotidyltransferase (UPF0157 family)